MKKTYKVRVIEGQVIDGHKSEIISLETYTSAESKKQAVNNVRFREGIRTGKRSIGGFGDYSYTRIEADEYLRN